MVDYKYLSCGVYKNIFYHPAFSFKQLKQEILVINSNFFNLTRKFSYETEKQEIIEYYKKHKKIPEKWKRTIFKCFMSKSNSMYDKKFKNIMTELGYKTQFKKSVIKKQEIIEYYKQYKEIPKNLRHTFLEGIKRGYDKEFRNTMINLGWKPQGITKRKNIKEIIEYYKQYKEIPKNLKQEFGRYSTLDKEFRNTMVDLGYIYSGKKQIKQICLNTSKIIKTWDSIADASKVLNIAAPHIGAVCASKRKSAGGYKWEYA